VGNGLPRHLNAGVHFAQETVTEAAVHVEDLDIAPGKIGETAQRIIDRATEEARRREHALLTNEHLFLAFAQVEWDMFSAIMRDVELNPHTILQAIEEHLHMMPSFAGRDLRVSPSTKLVF
jgi:ATP-dependent Clp protease ATP-binding subunit ClpA